MSTVAATDEDIVETRLIAKEAQLSKCVKRFNIFYNSVANKDKPVDDSDAVMQELLKDLAVLEQGMTGAALIQDVNQRELAFYEDSRTKIETNLTALSAEIAQLKEQLAREKELRLQKEEYDALGKQAKQFPSRRETEKQIEAVTQELAQKYAEEKAIAESLEAKQKQFGLLFHSLALLQQECMKESSSMVTD